MALWDDGDIFILVISAVNLAVQITQGVNQTTEREQR